jgi:transcriptional regulator with XRE-family HTH domain
MAEKAKRSITKRKASGIYKNKRSAGKPDIEIGKRIRLRRVEQHITESEFADKLGVSLRQLQKYEKGVNRVGASRLQQIATLLDVPVTFFYDEEGLGNNARDGRREVESLLFIDSVFRLRLLRAYSKVPQALQIRFVSLIESITGNK